MHRIFISLLLIFFHSVCLFAKPQGGVVKTGLVVQKWNLEDVTDPISEGTIPVEVIYSIMDNLNVQLTHLPAFSKFGNINMSGLSDTWIRSAYSFADNKALFSLGIGLPTGKTELNSEEILMTRLLSNQSFRFRLPVFGQGFTMSGGVMYAQPINDNFIVGGGFNYVFRGKYKFSEINTADYNPGDQFGLNIGFDYRILANLKSNIDFLYNIYTADKFNDTEVFSSGAKLTTKLGLQYQAKFGLIWLLAYYGAKAKNETWDGQSMVPESQNSNITQRELIIGTKIELTDILFVTANFDIRSYVENDYKQGYVDIFGGGVGYELMLTPKFLISMGFKLYFGDGEFGGINQGVSGSEFQLGTQFYF